MQLEPKETTAGLPFLNGGGEMGHLTRTFNWSATILGAPGEWPLSLKTTVSTIIHSRFPMFLWWGPELIQFYNDAYRPSLGNNGKHPAALGQKAIDCWPEIWSTIKPLIDDVLAGRGASWSEDQLIPIHRNGSLEDVYWTFGYSPVIGDDGSVEGVLVVCNETTEKVTNFKKLTEHKDELGFAIDAAELGTWDLNPRTNRFVGNQRLKAWYGFDENTDLNLELAISLISAKERETVQQAIQRALSPTSGGLYDTEYTIINRRTGQETTVRVKGKAIFDENDIPVRFSGIMQDITERKAKELLEDKNRQLERSNANLEEFTHIASHDLKEPMRKISFFTDRLKTQLHDRVSEDEKVSLSRIQNANHRMMALIDDLLLYSSISQRPLDMEPVDLNVKVAKVLEDLEVDISQLQAIFQIEPLPVVSGYRVQLQQLFQNLIGNALKYHQEGIAPVINISSRVVSGQELGEPQCAGDADNGYYRIEVKDNGIGFEQIHSEKIFQMFQRLHGNSEYRGTGVGLAIARKVAENHRGKINAESEPGKGSTFILHLPA